jgi:hypothetical protein
VEKSNPKTLATSINKNNHPIGETAPTQVTLLAIRLPDFFVTTNQNVKKYAKMAIKVPNCPKIYQNGKLYIYTNCS